MDTKQHILNRAEHLARTRGFDAFSYADLSNDIGIRKASIHYHFATKADLAAALVEAYGARFQANLKGISDANGTAADDIRAYIALYDEALSHGTRLCLCVSFSAARDSFDDLTLSRLNQFHQDSLDWLTRVFEKAALDGTVSGPIAEPSEDAHAVLAMVEGAQLISRAARSQTPFDMAVGPLRRRLTSPQKH